MASKVYGDMKKLKKMFSSLDKNVVGEVENYMKDQANEIKEEIHSMIKSQTGNWKPLDDSTVKAKGHSKILYETGTFVDSIDVTSMGDNTYVVAPTGIHGNGISNSDLAKLHEYGTAKMSPRPIFRPVYEEQEKVVPKEVSDIVAKEINKFK